VYQKKTVYWYPKKRKRPDFAPGPLLWLKGFMLPPHKLAIAGNMDEDTYAPMDLFDWLDIIKKLRDEGLTQAQIGERIGWSREQVRNYINILSKVGTQILDLARSYQKGRVPENGTIVPFDFTEGWFRTSGLYDLCEKYQLALIC